MIKICVCSDSHGNREGLKRMIELEKPDMVYFCGDGVGDIEGLLPPDRILAVRGNCDPLCPEPIIRETVCGGVRIVMTHGHRYSVKTTEDIFLSEALGRDAQVALYGHTHRQKASYIAGILLLNGGTMSSYNEYYALLMIENGVYDCCLKRLAQDRGSR